MALAKNPISSELAAATIGPSLSWFHDAGSLRARSKPSGRPRSTKRLGVVREQNATAFDAWMNLAPEVQRQWCEVARWRRYENLGGSWVMPGQLEYTRRCIRLLDAGKPLLTFPLPCDALPLLGDVAISRIPPDGVPVLTWSLWLPAPPGSSVIVSIGNAFTGSVSSSRRWPLRVLTTADASLLSLTFPDGEPGQRWVGIRPLSASGATWRFNRAILLPAF